MKFSVRFLVLTLFFAGLSSIGALYGASPVGERGGKLTAAEEAQQKLLRQLRRDIAIHRILSRQNSAPVKRNDPVKTAHVSTNTEKNVQYARASNGSSCSNTVDDCFVKLESLFQEHFGEEFQLTKSTAGNEEKLTQAGI